MKVFTRSIVLLSVTILAMGLWSCGSAHSSGIVVQVTGKCMGCPTSEAFNELRHLEKAGDKVFERAMMKTGNLYILQVGTHVRILNPGIESTTVRVLDGLNAGKKLIISSEFLKKAE